MAVGSKAKSYIGSEHNRLKITAVWPVLISGKRRYKCSCDCKCGKTFTTVLDRVIYGVTKSCGCLHDELSAERIKKQSWKHGDSIVGKVTRLYRIWQGMKKRCYDKNNQDYKDYGGRGITVCEEWIDNYEEFRDWAISNGYEDYLSIDRRKNDEGYSPDNCQWATDQTQARNKRKKT